MRFGAQARAWASWTAAASMAVQTAWSAGHEMEYSTVESETGVVPAADFTGHDRGGHIQPHVAEVLHMLADEVAPGVEDEHARAGMGPPDPVVNAVSWTAT